MATDYVKTPTEIGKLTTSMLDAEHTVTEGRITYLRALAATTIATLPQDAADKAAYLGALEATHERFYEAVTKAVQAAPPSEASAPSAGPPFRASVMSDEDICGSSINTTPTRPMVVYWRRR